MSEPTSESKHDNLEDSSSFDWTFVDRISNVQEETNNFINEETKKSVLNASDNESSKEIVEQKGEDIKQEDEQEESIEKGEEAGESDDVSVITDEETEITSYVEKRIEKLKPNNQLIECSNQPEKIDHPLFTKHRVQIIIAGMFILTIINTAFRYQELRYHVTLNERAFESFDKLKTASEFKENLQHFDHVANSLDDINYKMPAIKNLVDDLSKNMQNFMNVKINLEHTLKHLSHKIELVAALYKSYCIINEKIDPDNIKKQRKKSCKIPGVLRDMISYKNMWETINANNFTASKIPKENREEFLNALNADKKEIDEVVESLLSEFLSAYSKFALDVENIDINFKTKDNNYIRKENFATKDKEQFNEKSKGDVKNGWKKNKQEKKYAKRDIKENKKNKNAKQKREYYDSQEKNFNEKYESKRNVDFENKREYVLKNQSTDQRQIYKKKTKDDRNADYKNKRNDYDRNFDNNNKQYCETGNKCKKNKYREYDEDEDDNQRYSDKYNQHKKNKYFRFDETPDNYYNENYGDMEREQKSGEWLLERGSDRERQRNSDWYSARADSRQWARMEEEQQYNNNDKSNHQQQHRQYNSKKFCRQRKSLNNH